MLHYSVSLDQVFHALADPARRSMIERLSQGPASVKQLAEPLPITLTATLQHLRVLEASGLVRSEKTGRTRTCHLEVASLQNAQHWITERRHSWERRLDRLDRYLANQAQDE